MVDGTAWGHLPGNDGTSRRCRRRARCREAAKRRGAGGSADEEEGERGVGEEVGGGSTDEAIVDPSVSVGSGDEEGAAGLGGGFEDFRGGGAFGDVRGGGAFVGAGEAVGLGGEGLGFIAPVGPFGDGEKDERGGKGVGQLAGDMGGAEGVGGAIESDEDAPGSGRGRGDDETGAAGAADHAVGGGAGHGGVGGGVFAEAADDEEFGVRLEVGQDLRGDADVEGRRHGKSFGFRTRGGFRQACLAPAAEDLLDVLGGLGGIDGQGGSLSGNRRRQGEEAGVDDVGGFELGAELEAEGDGITARIFGAGRTVEGNQGVFDHGPILACRDGSGKAKRAQRGANGRRGEKAEFHWKSRIFRNLIPWVRGERKRGRGRDEERKAGGV